MRLTLTDLPDPCVREAIAGALGAFNTARAGPGEWRPLAVLIDDGLGAVTGGLWGVTSYGWLCIELLFVPAPARGRGLGSELVAQAETEALARGCRRAWVDTFEFQARGFYERLGYRLFGELPDYPAGSSRFFLQKTL
jgi:GNAT superfamily N-acetyltransferase